MVLGGLAFLAACEKKAAPSFERPPAPVTVTTAVTQDVPNYIDAIGKFVAREVVSIQPQVSGRITQIHFVDGADVKVGQVLFTIDQRPYQAQLNMAEANLGQAKAALELAKINFDRVVSVTDQRAVSRQDYDAKKNAVAVAEAQLKQNQAALDSARLNLDYCTIRSPINGRAGQRLVDLGNVVTANSGSLLVIQRLDPIYADFTITENDLTMVQRNMNPPKMAELGLTPKTGFLAIITVFLEGLLTEKGRLRDRQADKEIRRQGDRERKKERDKVKEQGDRARSGRGDL